jgi:HD-GYP domain-containing protein (c-di-GMP phosphodiesterase class II)
VESRIAQLAEFLEVAHRIGGIDAALDSAQRRSGKQFDPDLVALFTADVEKVFNGIDELESWDAVLDSEPSLAVTLSPDECDTALAAIARFVDLKSPYTLGHSQAVADLAATAARHLGLSLDESQVLYRAGLVSGLGRLGVSNAIWDKQTPLTAGEWERVRLHPQVLRLLARGMSNKQIAAHLVVTPKTVSNHVEHIYTKIDATGRAEACLFAMQHGMLPDHPIAP